MKRTLVVGFLTVLGLLSVGCNGTASGVLQPNPEDLFANARRSSRTFLISAIWRSTSRFPALLRKRLGLIPFSVGRRTSSSHPDASRTGRELQMFHVATAFLQGASVNAAD